MSNKIAAYVKSIDEKTLEPMYSYPRVKRYLKDGKAVVISLKPFVIKLTYETTTLTQSNHLGCDPGRTNIATVVIDDSGNIKYSAHIKTNNKDVPKHMTERAEHRGASRRGERKVRQRKAIKNGTTFKHNNVQKRKLPKCEKPIVNKYIKNSEARFANRKVPKGWITSTARHLLHTIIKSIDMACDLLPIQSITIEMNRWDFAKMENPNIKNWEYQKGKLFGYNSVEEAVYDRQGGKCLCCNKPIDIYHHVIPKHMGGSESIDNRCGLCNDCHNKFHTDKAFEEKLKAKQTGLLKKYHALSVMNQIMPYLLKELVKRYPDKDVYVTTGYETAKLRKKCGLPKTHVIDAWCIAMSMLDKSKLTPSITTEVSRTKHYEIEQFRHQDRAIIHSQRERAYKYNGVVVAKNRNKRTEQKDDALSDWFNKQVELYGIKEAERMRSRLTVTKSTRYYNTKNRLMPGAVFIYKKKRFVLSGQITNGAYYRAVGQGNKNFPARECTVIKKNTGLVYI